ATHAAKPYKEQGVVMSTSALMQIMDYPEIEVEVLPRGECRIRTIPASLVNRTRVYRWQAWQVQIDEQTAVNQVSHFVPPVIKTQIERGLGTFVNELRYVTPMFVQFGGIDYDLDPNAQALLDAYLKDVQQVIAETGGQ